MGNFCDFGWRSRRDTASSQAVADYLAGYAEALADSCADQRPQPED